MDQFFANVFEYVRYEKALVLIINLTDSNILGKSKFTDHETNIINNIAPEKLHWQRKLKKFLLYHY